LFANRFTALVDACCLAGALTRNLILSLAEAGFFRLRWSDRILDETESAIREILTKRNIPDAAGRAKKARASMEAAFQEAEVVDYDPFLSIGAGLPDKDDAHVLAAAAKTQAAILVTENLKDFPDETLKPLNLEARSSDTFIADTIALDPGRAVAAIRRMRERLKKPEKTAAQLLLDMEAHGLHQTAAILQPYVASL
jgi:predicted nucleic acid-binding protein